MSDKELKMKIEPPNEISEKEVRAFYQLIYTLAENRGYKVTPSEETKNHLKKNILGDKNERQQ